MKYDYDEDTDLWYDEDGIAYTEEQMNKLEAEGELASDMAEENKEENI